MNTYKLKVAVAKFQFRRIHFMDSLSFYFVKIMGRIVFPLHLFLRPGRYVNQETYFPECERKSKLRIFFDQLYYMLRTGEFHNYYFIFGFDRKGKNDYSNYVPWYTMTHRRNVKNQLPRKPMYNPYNHVCLLRDRFVFEAFCRGMGIKTPKLLAVLNDGELYNLDSGLFLPVENILNLTIDAFAKRNVPYGGGLDFNVVKLRIENGVIFINDEETSIEEFKKIIRRDTWIIQERIKKQHPFYASFHRYSINTLRIVTVQKDDEIHVVEGTFRTGTNKRIADNYSSGGISTVLDVKDGTLKKYGFCKPEYGGKTDRHPNSGIIFEGVKMPMWDEAVEMVKRTHRLFYNIHSIGWDVCVLEDGPILIEGNDNWDTLFVQENADLYKKYFK